MQLPPDTQEYWDSAPQGDDSWTYEEIIGMLDQTKDEDTIRKHVEETPTPTPNSSSEKSKASQPIAPPRKRRRIVPTINLSQLIDKKKLLEGERVKYIRKKEKRVLKEGFVRHQGIECCCCGQIYSMSKLEEHAGKASHRASQHIYLECGKSLANCQWELSQEANTQMESEWRPAQVSPMQSCSMPKLEEDAGKVSHRASQHIYLESGKSLANCQWELSQEANTQMESEWRPAQVSPMQSCSMPKLEEDAGKSCSEANLQIQQAESGVEEDGLPKDDGLLDYWLTMYLISSLQ
ncbi:hypothetical protein ACLOJK_003473 [Asimina triloba]